jgi:hypothetical protein
MERETDNGRLLRADCMVRAGLLEAAFDQFVQRLQRVFRWWSRRFGHDLRGDGRLPYQADATSAMALMPG